jgi:hypothetical protein
LTPRGNPDGAQAKDGDDGEKKKKRKKPADPKPVRGIPPAKLRKVSHKLNRPIPTRSSKRKGSDGGK